LQSLINFANRN